MSRGEEGGVTKNEERDEVRGGGEEREKRKKNGREAKEGGV